MTTTTAASVLSPYPWGPGAQRGRARALLVAGLLATNVAALACTVGFAAVGGQRGLSSALIAAAVVVAFFGIGQGVQVLMADRSPRAALWAAVASYVLRVVGLGVLLSNALPYADSGIVDRTALMVTLMVCVFAWLGAEIVQFRRMDIPVYDSEYVPPAPQEGRA